MNDHRKLTLPQNAKTEQDIAAEYIESMVMLPVFLEKIAGELELIRDSTGIIALYMEKKGIKDGLLKEDDLETGEIKK